MKFVDDDDDDGCVLAYFLCEHHVYHVTSDVTEASFKSSTLILVLLHQRRLLTLQRPQPLQHRTCLRRTRTNVLLQQPNTNTTRVPRRQTLEMKPPTQKFISYRYVLDLGTPTLKTFPAIPTHMMTTSINQSINLYHAIVQRRVLKCGYAESKRNVLRRILNVLTDGTVRQFSGRAFQSLGAATEKRRAAVSKFCGGTDRSFCVDDRSKRD